LSRSGQGNRPGYCSAKIDPSFWSKFAAFTFFLSVRVTTALRTPDCGAGHLSSMEGGLPTALIIAITATAAGREH
jgi:hypothetical protein